MNGGGEANSCKPSLALVGRQIVSRLKKQIRTRCSDLDMLIELREQVLLGLGELEVGHCDYGV